MTLSIHAWLHNTQISLYPLWMCWCLPHGVNFKSELQNEIWQLAFIDDLSHNIENWACCNEDPTHDHLKQSQSLQLLLIGWQHTSAGLTMMAVNRCASAIYIPLQWLVDHGDHLFYMLQWVWSSPLVHLYQSPSPRHWLLLLALAAYRSAARCFSRHGGSHQGNSNMKFCFYVNGKALSSTLTIDDYLYR